MKKFSEIKNCVHDSSGIDEPNEWFWTKINGIYYPVKKIEL